MTINSNQSKNGSEIGFQASGQKQNSAMGRQSDRNNGLMDIDMLDVADLEKERGGEHAPDHKKAAEADEELARARL